MPKATKPSKQKLGRLNKSEWIRSQPESMGAKDVVDKGKSEGIKLSLAQVYTARSAAKRSQKRTSKSNGRTAAPDDVRQEFTRLAMRLGTDEAQRILGDLVEGRA